MAFQRGAGGAGQYSGTQDMGRASGGWIKLVDPQGVFKPKELVGPSAHPPLPATSGAPLESQIGRSPAGSWQTAETTPPVRDLSRPRAPAG